jgi:hypothetical protein
MWACSSEETSEEMPRLDTHLYKYAWFYLRGGCKMRGKGGKFQNTEKLQCLMASSKEMRIPKKLSRKHGKSRWRKRMCQEGGKGQHC